MTINPYLCNGIRTTFNMKNLLSLTFWIVLISCIAALSGCNPQPEAPALLTEAETLMETNPDSAMLLIDSIFYPEASLSRKQYMHYLLARVQARYKNYRDISSDTLIVDARNYFVKHANKRPKQAATAEFYTGCVYREQKDYAQAMQYYKRAEHYAVQSGDSLILGLVYYNMGDLLHLQGHQMQALKNYKIAEVYYRSFPEKYIAAMEAIGLMYALTGKSDSALTCFHVALDKSEAIGNTTLQDQNLQHLSITYRETGNFHKAEEYLRKAFRLIGDTAELPRYYLNFAKLYRRMDKPDSTTLYVEHLKQHIDLITNNYIKYSAYGFLAEREKEMRNYNNAFLFQSRQIVVLEDILEEQKEQSVYEIQQKYDYEHIQNLHNRTQISRQRLIIFILISGILIAVIAVFLLRRLLIQKNKMLKMQEIIQILKKTANDLQSSSIKLKNDKEKWRKTLLWKFSIQQKAVQFSNNIAVTEKVSDRKLLQQFERIVYGENIESQWKMLAETMEDINPGLLSFLEKEYPQLSNTELKVCLLSYFGLRSKDIAMILHQSNHTIDMKRSTIRKKMGMEKADDFYTSLKELYPQQK